MEDKWLGGAVPCAGTITMLTERLRVPAVAWYQPPLAGAEQPSPPSAVLADPPEAPAVPPAPELPPEYDAADPAIQGLWRSVQESREVRSGACSPAVSVRAILAERLLWERLARAQSLVEATAERVRSSSAWREQLSALMAALAGVPGAIECLERQVHGYQK